MQVYAKTHEGRYCPQTLDRLHKKTIDIIMVLPKQLQEKCLESFEEAIRRLYEKQPSSTIEAIIFLGPKFFSVQFPIEGITECIEIESFLYQ